MTGAGIGTDPLLAPAVDAETSNRETLAGDPPTPGENLQVFTEPPGPELRRMVWEQRAFVSALAHGME